MESSTLLNVMSGYGVHMRALRNQDLVEHRIKLPEPTEFTDCVAIEGEDMAVGLAAVVDLRHGRLVWRDRDLTSDKFDEDEVTLIQAVETVITLTHPDLL